MGWPMSRFQVRQTLTRSGITPLRKPHDILMVDGSPRCDWCRFRVPLSHLATESLPMLIDRRTGRYVTDDVRLTQTVVLAFLEPISDIVVDRSNSRWLVEFTIYLFTSDGTKSADRRRKQLDLSWDAWANLNR